MTQALVEAARRPPGGHDPSQQRRHEAHPRGRGEDAGVDANFVQPRDQRVTRVAEQRHAPDGGEQAQRAGDGREHQTLEQQQTHEAAARGAERHAHGQFPLAARRPDQDESGDARGRQQQHEQHRSGGDPEGALQLRADYRIEQRLHRHPPSAVFGRPLLGELRRNHIEVTPDGGGVRASRRSREHAERVRVTRGDAHVRVERQPDVGGRVGDLESCRHDANHEHRLPAEAQRPSDHVARGAEPPLPVTVTQHADLPAHVGRFESPTEHRHGAKDCKQLR